MLLVYDAAVNLYKRQTLTVLVNHLVDISIFPKNGGGAGIFSH